MKSEHIKAKISQILNSEKIMKTILFLTIAALSIYFLGLALPVVSNIVRGINDLTAALNGK